MRHNARLRFARLRADRARAGHLRRLRNHDFSVVSNDCWGAEIYRHLGLPYRTPFVGLFLFAPCYIRLLEDLEGALRAPLTFVDASRYQCANEDRATRAAGPYPIGVLCGDIEIHFVHHASERTARESWSRRTSRVDPDNLFVKFSADKDACTLDTLARFDALAYAHKVCLSREPYERVPSARRVKGWDPNGANLFWIGLRQFDWIAWLNRQTATPQPVR